MQGGPSRACRRCTPPGQPAHLCPAARPPPWRGSTGAGLGRPPGARTGGSCSCAAPARSAPPRSSGSQRPPPRPCAWQPRSCRSRSAGPGHSAASRRRRARAAAPSSPLGPAAAGAAGSRGCTAAARRELTTAPAHPFVTGCCWFAARPAAGLQPCKAPQLSLALDSRDSISMRACPAAWMAACGSSVGAGQGTHDWPVASWRGWPPAAGQANRRLQPGTQAHTAQLQPAPWLPGQALHKPTSCQPGSKHVHLQRGGVGHPVAVCILRLGSRRPHRPVDLRPRPNHNHQLRAQACRQRGLRVAACSAPHPPAMAEEKPAVAATACGQLRRCRGVQAAAQRHPLPSCGCCCPPCSSATSSSSACRTSFCSTTCSKASGAGAACMEAWLAQVGAQAQQAAALRAVTLGPCLKSTAAVGAEEKCSGK